MEFLDESLLYFGLLIGTMMTGWSVWMLFLHIRKSKEQRKNSSVGLWIILLALLLGLGALGKPLRTIVERFSNNSYWLENGPSRDIAKWPFQSNSRWRSAAELRSLDIPE